MYCPVCSAITVEVVKLICSATATEPDEYQEYSACYVCGWTDLPMIKEEIPF